MPALKLQKERKKMAGIALYNALTKLGLEPEEAKEAVAGVASSKEIATKSDLKIALAELETKLTEKIANQEARLSRQMYTVTGITIAAVGLMIKFL